MSFEAQITQLAKYFLEEEPDKIGEGGAVDNAIRELRNRKEKLMEHQ